MADEIIVPQEQQIQEPKNSPVEQKAMDQGWVPQDQWSGAPEDWRPAKEYVDRGELFKTISELKRENKNIRQAFDEFGRQHARVKELEFERAFKTLKAQKAAAAADQDIDTVIRIDDKIDELREQQKHEVVAPRVPDAPQVDPVFQTWINRNQWYANDIDMKAVADETGRRATQAGVSDKAEILATVDKAVRRAFPHKFNNPKRDEPSSVEGSTNKGTQRQSDPTAGMTGTERRIMETILKSTKMSREEYLKQYKDVKVRGA